MSRSYPVGPRIAVAARARKNDVDRRTADPDWGTGHRYAVGGPLTEGG